MCMFVRVFWGRKYTITYFMIIALYKKSKGKHNFKIYRLPFDSFSISKPKLLAAQARIISAWNPWFGLQWEMPAMAQFPLVFLLAPSKLLLCSPLSFSSTWPIQVTSPVVGSQISSRLMSWGKHSQNILEKEANVSFLLVSPSPDNSVKNRQQPFCKRFPGHWKWQERKKVS